jgi:hypothetical protein
MELTDWPMQREIERLIESDYAEFDASSTGWRLQAAERGTVTEAHPMYRWTVAGKEACFRYANSTPMAWARAMHEGNERHCASCGKDLYRKQVGAAILKGPAALRNRCICLTCHAKGITLKSAGVTEG